MQVNPPHLGLLQFLFTSQKHMQKLLLMHTKTETNK